MTRFAEVLEDLVEVGLHEPPLGDGCERAEHDEPHDGGVRGALRALSPTRRTRAAQHIRMMGGDLVRDGQRAWFQYIAANMNDILDAYSVHIYWDYWNTPFFTRPGSRTCARSSPRSCPSGPQADLRHGVRRARDPQLRRQADRRVGLLGGRDRHGPDEHRRIPAALVRPRVGPARVHRLGQVGRVLGQVQRRLQLSLRDDRAGRQRDGRCSRPTTRWACCSRRRSAAGRWSRWPRGTRTTGRWRRPTSRRRSSRHTRSRRPPHGDGARLARPRPQHRLGERPAVQRRRPAAEDDVHPRGLERDGNGENTLAGTVTTNAAGVARSRCRSTRRSR